MTLGWDIDHGSMIVKITNHGRVVMTFFLGEAMEMAGKTVVLAHVQECERAPYARHWHKGHTKAST